MAMTHSPSVTLGTAHQFTGTGGRKPAQVHSPESGGPGSRYIVKPEEKQRQVSLQEDMG